MTKKQWSSLNIGDKVWTKSEKLTFENGKCTSTMTIRTGIIKRANSNFSQVLVDFGDMERWYGRFGIEHIDSIDSVMEKTIYDTTNNREMPEQK